MSDPVYVTKPFLPDLSEFIPYLEEIWRNKTLTNGGPLHQQFEQALSQYLAIEHVALFTNGTIALVSALQALRITGEVITTPYSFVATAHSLLWNGIKPVFADIGQDGFNLDPTKVEAAITPRTTAIMAVHCYGIPCDVKALQNIADNYNLKIIYDAAHAFGVRDHGGSILRYGDLSTLSFHATKVFHTFEGGAIVCPDAKTKVHIDRLKNFGYVDEVTVVAPGINGKMNEVSAAMGLLQLKYVDKLIEDRRAIDARYRKSLGGLSGITCPVNHKAVGCNFSYFPILVSQEYPMTRDELYDKLKRFGIYARRYFYPLISEFPMYRGLTSARRENLPVASDISQRVLCLPIYPALSNCDQDRIVSIIGEV
jgi:dTDP-4-amino-4,6-dideoxygalactose transaminase